MKRSLYVLDLRPTAPADAAHARQSTELLVVGLAKAGITDVRTPADLDAMLQAERQRDLVGCSDVTCAAEIAGACGLDLIAYGSVTSAGEERSVAVTIVGKDGAIAARSVVMTKAAESAALAVDTLVRELMIQLAPHP